MNQFDTRHDVRSARGVRARRKGASRIVDVVLASAALVLLSPVFLLIGLAIWLEDRNPVITRHRRTSADGRTFHSYRFRTIRAAQATRGAEVTRLGVVLRMLRLDELPLLVNVIRGEMSLTGSRRRAVPPSEG